MLAPPGLVKFSKDEAPPARKEFDKGEKGLETWKKAVKVFNKKVKYNDRGIGALEVAGDDADEKKLAKENDRAAAANGKAYEKKMKEITDAKAAKLAAKAAAPPAAAGKKRKATA